MSGAVRRYSLAPRIAAGGALRIAAQSRSSAASSPATGTMSLTRPKLKARSASIAAEDIDEIGQRLARQPVDEGREHHRRQDVVLHLGRLEHRVGGGERDVAAGREGAAEADGGALH